MKYLRFLTACFLLNLLVAFTVNATPRAPDTYLYDGKSYHLYRFGDSHKVYPMEAYFSKFPGKRPKTEGLTSSFLRRGYLATFEIVNDYLVLNDIEIQISGGLDPDTHYPRVSRQSVLEGLSLGGEPLRIDWYTGILELVRGELLEEAQWLEPLKHKGYTLLEIKNGKLIDNRTFSFKEYEQFKDKQFQLFKQTEQYKVKRKRDLETDSRARRLLVGTSIESFPSPDPDLYMRDRIVNYTSQFLTEKLPLTPILLKQ